MTSELRTRILSAVVLIALVGFIAWWSADSFAMLCAFGFFILLKEWRDLIQAMCQSDARDTKLTSPSRGEVDALASGGGTLTSAEITPARPAGDLPPEGGGKSRLRYVDWFAFGLVYLGAGAAALAYLRYENLNILAATIAIVAVGDSAAYLVGRKIGKHKIAPTISPGKSWEGLAASILASAATGATLGHIAPIPHAILGALLAILGLGGDLFESWLKRRAGVKDSGTLIPGHGGLFDRVDALLPCAIFAAIALYARLHLG